MMQKAPTVCSAPVLEYVYPKVLLLARSALVQAQAQASLITLLQLLVRAGLPSLTQQDVFRQLYNTEGGRGDVRLSKQSLFNLSKCIAGVTFAFAGAEDSSEWLQRFTTDLTDSPPTQRQLALLCVGEVGQRRDLSHVPHITDLLLACFEAPAENTKLCAAYALGHIAVGNMGTFLPCILSPAPTPKHQYLLLAALKEMVTAFASLDRDFAPHLDEALPLLLQQCRSPEESVRGMVAECLGVLTSMLSAQIIPLLQQLAAEEDKLGR
ncbi:armadillo-type protein [Ochromonadaceae sp. CCMP2298]|nr:armadillo-type protein [Ochromonadaceae sp. CCMP2298]